MADFPKFSHVVLHVPGAIGASGAFSSVVSLVHNCGSVLLADHTLLYELLNVISHLGPKYCISCPKEASLLTLVTFMYVLEHLWLHLSWHYDSVSTSNES